MFVLSGISIKGELKPKTVMIGLLCGTCFALTSLYVREAANLLDVPFPHSAAWVLLMILCIQTFVICGYISIKQPVVFRQLAVYWKATVATSTISCLGSICWFSAMTIQYVAYVKTLGQIEVLFTILISAYWLKTPVKKHEVAAICIRVAKAT